MYVPEKRTRGREMGLSKSLHSALSIAQAESDSPRHPPDNFRQKAGRTRNVSLASGAPLSALLPASPLAYRDHLVLKAARVS